jgi:aminopeptidase-like protein
MVEATADLEKVGREMYALAVDLYPIHRGITGDGLRETLAILKKHVPLEIMEVCSGTQVFDWQVPQEWNVRDAFIKNSDGRRIVDYRDSNLHVVNYSQPVCQTMAWSELKKHLVTMPDRPDWIPYRRVCSKEKWGFCLSHRQFLQLDEYPEREYEVCIDATFKDGSLTYGEACLPGETDDEVLISTHVCHPSMANDNLSGVAVATFLAKHLQSHKARHSYRFIFIPAVIGAITWLSENRQRTGNIKHGLVLSCLGDAGDSTYERSRRGDAEIDRALVHVLKHSDADYAIRDFDPTGYDQRQFCSPGFDLPVGCFMRTPNDQYPEYHTSADDLDFIHPHGLADSWLKCALAIEVLENNRRYLNRNPFCEPQLGKHGLYTTFGDEGHDRSLQRAVLWVLNFSDGEHDLLDIAERSNLSFGIIERAARDLVLHGLLTEIETLPRSEIDGRGTDTAMLHGLGIPGFETRDKNDDSEHDSREFRGAICRFQSGDYSIA